MKKTSLLLVLAASALTFVGCTKNKPATTTSTISQGEISVDSQSSQPTKESATSTPIKNIFDLALKQDYTNMYAEVTQSYANGEEGEFSIETYYNGYTIVYDELAALYGYDPYLYYHNYNNESYLYFTPDSDSPTPKAAWLNKGYRDAPLGIEHTYFSMEALLAHISPDDVSYGGGAYYINSPEKIQELNQTVFSFAWYNHLSDISFVVQDGRIVNIIGFDDLNNNKNFVKVALKSFGTVTFDEKKLPDAPNEDNVMEYWQYKGWDGPLVDKFVTSITAAVDSSAVTEEGFDAVLDIEHSVKVTSTYAPDDANKKTINWRSSDEKVAKVTYDKDGNRVIYAVGEGEATIYAYNNENKAGEVVSNGLKIKVKGLQSQNKEGAVYDFTYKSVVDGNVVAENELGETLPFTITSTKAVVQDGGNSEIWTKADKCVVMNPSTNGMGGATITYDFDDQQVSGISFYYALYYGAGVSNLSFLKTAVIETSNDGETWTTIDIKEEVVNNISVNNLKLMEKTFEPASKVRISLDTGFTGKNIHFAFTEMAFIANENCHSHVVTPDTVAVTDITASCDKTELYAGKTATMTALVAPANATNKTVRWVSSNEEVATVDANGVVTAVAQGTAQIYAVNDASEVESNKVEITVNPAITTDSRLVGKWVGEADSGLDDVTINILSTGSMTVVCGEDSYDMTLVDFENNYYVFETEDGESQINIKYATSYTNKADVSGKIGSKTIAKYTGKTYSKVIDLTSITLSASETTIAVGHTTTIAKTLAPTNTTETEFEYSTSSESIATVSSAGVVTGVAPGTATITVTAGNGVTATIDIVVEAKSYPTSVVISGGNSVEIGKTITLSASLSPSTASEKTFTWVSSDTTVATINSRGELKGLKVGTTTISVKLANNEVIGSYVVNVTAVSNEKVPSEMVGDWTGDDVYGITTTITINGDGTGTLESMMGYVDFELQSKSDNEYTFIATDDTELVITFDGESISVTYEGSDVYSCIDDSCEFTK